MSATQHRGVMERRRTQFGTPFGRETRIALLDTSMAPAVFLTAQAHGKMWALVQACDIEIGWFATCTRDEGGNVVIDDVFVPHQVCTIATTTITKDGEAQLLSTLMGEGRADTIKRLLCWGHSHVDMQVLPSGTDEEQTNVYIKKHAKQGYFVRIIGNKQGALAVSVYLLDEGFVVHHPLLRIEKSRKEWAQWAKREIKAKVIEGVFSVESYKNSKFSLKDISLETLGAWLKSGRIDYALHDKLAVSAPKGETVFPLTTERITHE